MSASESMTFCPPCPSISERARKPLSNRPSALCCVCVIGLLRPVLIGIARDLGVKDRQAGLELGDMRADMFPMLNKKLSSFGLGRRTFRTQTRVSHHVSNPHPGCFQPPEKLDPRQDGNVILSLARNASRRTRQQPNPLIISDGMSAQAGAFGEVSDFHALPCVLKGMTLRFHKLERALSQALFWGRLIFGFHPIIYESNQTIVRNRDRGSSTRTPL